MSKKLYRLNVGMALVLLIITALTTTVLWIRASNITTVQDLMSNQSIGGFSTHRISFNLSGGNQFLAGEVIAVDFPTEFTLGGTWATSDFMFVDSIARDILIINQGPGVSTVTCAQDGNNVGIAVDTTANTFRVIPCSGGSPWSPSGAGAPVSLTINGANPNGTIANPVAVGGYEIVVLDAAGDCSGGCSMGVPIVDSDSVSVMAEVVSTTPAVCGNGIPELGEQCDDGNLVNGDGCSSTCTIEGGAPPPTDTTPPVITYHCASDITKDSATISWDTNEPADSLVRCGKESGVYTILQTSFAYVLEHRIPLSGLEKATTYYCQVCSKDSAGNMACSDECFFSTLDEVPPSITNLRCTDATATSFTVRWTTNEISSSYVDYDEDPGPPYDYTTGNPTMVTDHVVPVTGLAPGTNYHYRARSGDISGNEVLSADTLCGTIGGPPPEITNVRATDVGCFSAIIRWDTNIGTDSAVDYGTVAGPPYEETVSDPTFVVNHEILLPDLESGTLYHYQPRSTDLVGNIVTGADHTFTTFGDGPLIISNVQATNVTTSSATIIWDTNKNADSAVDFGKNGNYSQSSVDSTMVMGHSIDLTGLESCTEYLYRVRSTDLCDDSAGVPKLNFTTTSAAVPSISNLQVTMVTRTSARVSWDTDLPTDGTVEYGPTTAYGSVETNATSTTSHLFTLTGLTPGTTYHFQVSSADACKQLAASVDRTFTTQSDDVPPGCAVSLTAAPGNAQNFVSWVNPTDPDLAGTRLLRKTGGCPTSPTDGTIIYEGFDLTLIDSGLMNGVTYCYGAFPYDASGNFGCGATGSATPVGPPDTTPPACPSNFRAYPGDDEVLLQWDNPTDPDFLGVRIKRGLGTDCPTNELTGTTIYEGTGEIWRDVTAHNGLTYCYTIFSYDLSLNFCGGVGDTATPLGPEDSTPPACATSLVVIPGDGQNLLTWENPADLDLVGVRVVRRDDRYPATPTDGTVIFEGLADHVYDIGLTNGVTYYYGVFTYDEVPNYCIGAFGQGTPEEGLPPPAPSCTDTDGGRNYFERGTVRLTEDLQYIDACVDAEILQENYCTGSTLAMEDYDCGLGYRCENGACVPDIFEPPPEQCGNGICEQPVCEIECGEITYDLYIINPDGSERHMNTEWVKVTELETNLNIISFEDKGEDWDYNDVEFRLDTRNCRHIGVTLISHNAAWNHQVRLLIRYRGVPKLDKLVWHDSHVEIGHSVYLDATTDPSMCAGIENINNCPEDCLIEEVKPPEPIVTIKEEERISADRLRYYATEGRLRLVVEGDGVSMYPSNPVTVVLPFDELPKTAKSAYLSYESNLYVMVPTEEGFEAKVDMPVATGEYQFAIIVDYVDDTVDVISGHFHVMPYPRVLADVENRLEGVEGARVTLLVDIGGGIYGLWNGDSFGELNPMATLEQGEFGYIIPPGNYILRAERPGYHTKETLPFPVTGNLITRDLLLINRPDAQTGLSGFIAYLFAVGKDNYGEFVDNAFVEGTTQEIAPAILAVSTANVLVAGAATATAVPYLLYLYSFLTHPSLLLAARRRKKWGVVFNSITKQPVDLAIVRLLDEKTGRIIRSMVTDRSGRYFFMVNQGSYRITVAKVAFIFPTVYLKGELEDIRYVDLYHGEPITVSESTSITANIPIDPVTQEKTPRRVVWEGITRRFQRSLGIITLVAMAGAAIITPTPFILSLFAANVVMYLFFRRLARGRKPKNWGIVYDNQTKKPLRNAVVRVFEARYNKLLETRVTDIRGRYAFLVGTNVYYVTYEKPGYQKKQIGPLDLVEVKKEEDQLIASDIPLESVVGRSTMQILRDRFQSIFNPLGKSKAKVDKEPLAHKIGMTGSLIVGPGAKVITAAAEQKKAEEVVAAKSAKKIPWELRVLRQGAVKKEEPKAEAKKEPEMPPELKELQNLRYDSENTDKNKPE